MLAIAFGLGLGTVAGLSVGPYVFPKMTKPKDFSFLHETADKDDSIKPPPLGSPVGEEMRGLLQYCAPWTLWPDYQRVHMVNRMIQGLWPTLTRSILNEVFRQMQLMLRNYYFGRIHMLEDIIIGAKSLRNTDGDFSSFLGDIKAFTCGTRAIQLGGIKPYFTSEDEVIMESPILWGSDSQFDVGILLKIGPFRFYIPVTVKDITMKMDCRVTLKPLTDVIPCFGGMNLTMLDAPVLEYKLMIAHGVDIMAIPIIKELMGWVVKYVLNTMFIYPNSFSVPIMTGYGVPEPIKGALTVTLLFAEGVRKGDIYFSLAVRKGREQKSKTTRAAVSRSGHASRAEFGEEFNFVIDSFTDQKLNFYLWLDDFSLQDKLIGIGSVPFGRYMAQEEELADQVQASHEKEATAATTSNDGMDFKPADFIKAPMTEVTQAVNLLEPCKEMKVALERGKFLEPEFIRPAVNSKEQGTVYVKTMFVPFFQPTFDDEEELTEAQKLAKERREASVIPSTRSVATNITDKLKGVLTINLIRCVDLDPSVTPNFYVKFSVVDEDTEQIQVSRVRVNETNPRWGDIFDFVMVTAGATLHVAVVSERQKGVVSRALSAGTTKEIVVGKLQFPLRDVVANVSLKDNFVLSGTEQGSIELALKWHTCFVSDD